MYLIYRLKATARHAITGRSANHYKLIGVLFQHMIKFAVTVDGHHFSRRDLYKMCTVRYPDHHQPLTHIKTKKMYTINLQEMHFASVINDTQKMVHIYSKSMKSTTNEAITIAHKEFDMLLQQDIVPQNSKMHCSYCEECIPPAQRPLWTCSWLASC